MKRRRGRRDRLMTASWCRSAMISRCSEARDWTRNRNEWSSETTTEDTTAGYRRMPGTSIDATRTKFSVTTRRSASFARDRVSASQPSGAFPRAQSAVPAQRGFNLRSDLKFDKAYGQRRHLTLKAFGVSLKRLCPDADLLHHSDKGCTYASEDYPAAFERRANQEGVDRMERRTERGVPQAPAPVVLLNLGRGRVRQLRLAAANGADDAEQAAAHQHERGRLRNRRRASTRMPASEKSSRRKSLFAIVPERPGARNKMDDTLSAFTTTSCTPLLLVRNWPGAARKDTQVVPPLMLYDPLSR